MEREERGRRGRGKKAGRKTARGGNHRVALRLIYLHRFIATRMEIVSASGISAGPVDHDLIGLRRESISRNSFPTPCLAFRPRRSRRARDPPLLSSTLRLYPRHAAQGDDFLFKCGEHAHRAASLSGKRRRVVRLIISNLRTSERTVASLPACESAVKCDGSNNDKARPLSAS